MNVIIEKLMNTEQLYKKDAYLSSMEANVLAVDCNKILLDRTVFYPTGGGQPGDTGHLTLEGGASLRVINTRSDRSNRGLIWHEVSPNEVEIKSCFAVKGSLDWDRRYELMKMHTCLHVLSSIIEAPITGCSISENKGRLDFDLPDPVLDKEGITKGINEILILNRRVISFDVGAKDSGKYIENYEPGKFTRGQEPLTMVEIDGVNVQPCGGTHVRNTNEIPKVKCIKIEKKSKTNRRVVISWE